MLDGDSPSYSTDSRGEFTGVVSVKGVAPLPCAALSREEVMRPAESRGRILGHALPPRPRSTDSMGMADAARRYTVDEVLAFPDDGNRYELVDGELLVTPAPSLPHQWVLSRLHAALIGYVSGRTDVIALFSPADITWDREKLVQPDLFVFPAGEASASWKTVRTLLLTVEVVSPSSARADRLVKRRLYQRQRVRTYWIVDPDARLAEIWHPDDTRPEIVSDVLRWRAAADADELVIELPTLFAGLPK